MNLRPLTVACAALLLAGCSITDKISESGRIDYRSQSTTRSNTLQVPPDLVGPRGDERYSIPERTQRERTLSGYQSARAAADTKAAETSQVLADVKGMRIERSGSQRWLVVDQPADRLWPQVVDFWRDSGFNLSLEQPEIGLMETDWAENRAKISQDLFRNTIGRFFDNLYSSGERDRFRVRFEKAPGGGTELHLTHRGLSEEWTSERKENTIWKPRPSDPELEAEFLRRLMIKLGTSEAAAAQSVAGVAPATNKARIVESAEGNYVELPEGFDRAWRRVGVAMDRGGFTVEDRDRSKGLYFVRYIDPEVEGKGKTGGILGWFSREKKATSAQQYRIFVEGSGEASRVRVLAADGKAVSAESDRRTAVKILTVLREQLQF